MSVMKENRIMEKELSLLYLTQQDTRAAGAGDMAGCVEAMEDAMRLLATGDYIMGGPNRNSHGIKLYFDKESEFPNKPVAGPDRRFMALVAYLGGEYNVCGTKWYGSNIKNTERGLPRSIHTITLNDPDTGGPLCIMVGGLISASRTGAMAGVGAKYLIGSDSSVFTQIGVGVIGRACCEAILTACPNIKELRIVDLSEKAAVDAVSDFSSRFDIKAYVCRDTEEAIKGSDIINFANSGSVDPELKLEWLAPGSTVLTVADFPLDPAVMRSMTIAVDNWEMFKSYVHEALALPPEEKKDNGDLIDTLTDEVSKGGIREEDLVHLSRVVNDRESFRRDEKPLLCIIEGMCIEDVAWGYRVYQNAKARGLGVELPLGI